MVPPPDPSPRAARVARLTALSVAAVVTGAVVLLILLRPGVPAQWDQTFIGYQLSEGGYPPFDTGIVAYLLAGALNAVVPYDPVTSNTLMRALAALLYMVAAALLAWSVTGPGRTWGFSAFLLLLVSARFPFLWLSSELFAGAFLMLFLWSLVRGHSTLLTGLFLVLFSLTKPDLALPGVLVGAYLVLRPGPEPRWRRAAVLGGIAAVLVAPGLLGSSGYYEQFGGRTWVSFGQHYGELVRSHQLGSAPEGWGAWPEYLAHGFPLAGSVGEAILYHPRQYLHFLALSFADSTFRLLVTKLLLLVPLAVYLFRRLPGSWRVTVLLLLTNLVPIFLFSFLHMRYQARLYPLTLFVIFAGLGEAPIGTARERGVASVLALVFLWQMVDVLPVLRSGFWLPD
jgi:hypothetical protein